MRRKKQEIKEEPLNKKELVINIAIILVTAFFGISLIKNIASVAKTKSQIVQTAEEIKKLTEENKILKERISEVDSQSFVEAQIRDKLGLAKPGETVLVLPDPELLRRLAPSENIDPPMLPEANWEKWYKLFF